MEIITVDRLMVPIDEYASVGEDATLYEAVKALEKAQEELDRKHYQYLHRAILVLDKNRKVIGKISQLDVLTALEPRYKKMGDMKHLSKAGFSSHFVKSMMESFSLCEMPFSSMCINAMNLNVKELMHAPTEGEFIEAEASLCEALHMLIMGHHQSLLVTTGGEIVGILRLTDVFKEGFQMMKSYENRSQAV
jgi:CBS domain-containing protein